MTQQQPQQVRPRPILSVPKPAPGTPPAGATLPAPRGAIFGRPTAASPTQRAQRRQARGNTGRGNEPRGTVTAKVFNQDEGELLIFGTIGWDWFGEGVTDKSFNDALDELGDVEHITLRINSGGGDVFHATAIYNMLVKHGAHVKGEVEGVAASAATLIAMACHELSIAENAHWMVHRASGGAWGNADAIRQYLDLLDNADEQIRRTYAARTGMSDAELVELLKIDNWMTAARALELGFVDALDPLNSTKPHVTPENAAAGAAWRMPALTPERLAAISGSLHTLAASVPPAPLVSNHPGPGPSPRSQKKDLAMNKELRAKCVKAGMADNLTDADAKQWLITNWDKVMGGDGATGTPPRQRVKAAKTEPLRAETKEEFIERCIGEGNSEESCELKWDETDAPAESRARAGRRSRLRAARTEPLRSESKEEFIERCIGEGGDEESCELKWNESEPSDRARGRATSGLSTEEVIDLLDQRDRRAAAQAKAFRREVDDTLALAFGDSLQAPAALRDACYGLQAEGIAAVRAKILAARKEGDEALVGTTPVIRLADVQSRDRHLSAIRAGVMVRALRNFQTVEVRPGVNGATPEQILEKHFPSASRPKGWEDFCQMPLLESARECLLAGGLPYEQIRRLAPSQIAMTAMGFGHAAGLRADAGYALHTTGGLAEITRDAINKSLVIGYEESPQTWRGPFRQGTSVADFKDIRRVRLSAAQNLPAWVDNTEPELAKLANEAEKYAVEARALTLSFSWRLVVNDDLDAISRSPQLLGDASGRTVNAEAWRQITLNALLADGQALFLETPAGNRKRSNYITGAATPTNTSIGLMRALMRVQRGLNKPDGTEGDDILNLTPSFIAGPAALEELILKQVLSTADPAAGGNSQVYNTARTLTPIIEPLLDAASVKAFYLFAASNRVDTVEVTFLQGQETPIAMEYVNPKTLSQDYTILQTFAAKALDFRGMVKHKGEA